MRSELKVGAIWICGGIVSWIIDVLVDPSFNTMPLIQLFWLGSSRHDIFMRTYMFAAFLLFAAVSYFLVGRHNNTHDALLDANEKISTLSSSATISGLLPICAYCKRIRDKDGNWTKVETYIEQHSTAEFTHGICNECEKNL